MRLKKGQVTMFIIVGLLILIAVVFIVFVSSTISDNKIKRSIEDMTIKFDREGEYYHYIHECTSQAMKNGLFLVGMQAGPIYDYQATGGKHYLGPGSGYPYGQYVIPYDHNGKIYNVSYGIVAPQTGSLYHPVIPYYPYGITKLVSNPKIISPFYVNVFGNFPSNPMTPLCDSFGKNRMELSETVVCETYDSRNEHDGNCVQEYLERYIENYTMSCIKLERFPELSSYSVKKGNATARITFGESHVMAEVEMPVFIELDDVKSVIKLKDFEVRENVRLKKLHELASHMIDNEVNNVFFNIVRDAGLINDCKDITGGNTYCLKDGMQIAKMRNVCLGQGLCIEGNYDDVLTITDYESLMNGRPYVFQFAIENRPPALDLIREEIGTGSFNYDYVVFENEVIDILPTGIDPDEDQHNSLGYMDHMYNYYGWKEDYGELYDPLCGPLHDPDCQVMIPDPTHNWTRQ